MHTLSRAITARILNDTHNYIALRHQWRTLVNSERKHELSAAHHVLYLMLIGKDWRKAFTPPTNRRKLENGAFQGWILFRALNQLQMKTCEAELLAPFDGVVTSEMLQALRGLMPRLSPYRYRPEQFANGAFPFEAYVLPEMSSTVADKDVTHAG